VLATVSLSFSSQMIEQIRFGRIDVAARYEVLGAASGQKSRQRNLLLSIAEEQYMKKQD